MPQLPRIRRCFTLIELLVSVVILIALIAAVGVMFRSATRAVGTSEASLELLSNVRAAQDQIAHDLQSFDASTFMIIRHRTIPRPANTPADVEAVHVDQIAFIANGNFSYKTPGGPQAPLGDSTAHAALIWYGHLVVEGRDIANGNTHPVADQAAPLRGPRTRPLDVLPSGRSPEDFLLGRHATLLLSPSSVERTKQIIGGQIYPAYSDATFYAPAVGIDGEGPAHITSSRLSLASVTPSEIMRTIIDSTTRDPKTRSLTESPRGDPPAITETAFCFRFKTLMDPLETEIRKEGLPSLPNGVQRMSSIFLQGVVSFQVGIPPSRSAPHGQKFDSLTSGDDDVDIFSYDTDMPPSLTIVLRVIDPTHRFPSGRTFQQTVAMPHASPRERYP